LARELLQKVDGGSSLPVSDKKTNIVFKAGESGTGTREDDLFSG
jgi:hypothetical protein